MIPLCQSALAMVRDSSGGAANAALFGDVKDGLAGWHFQLEFSGRKFGRLVWGLTDMSRVSMMS